MDDFRRFRNRRIDIQKAQECGARMLNSNSVAGNKKIKTNHNQHT
jgi:hypothetical protein